jgi:hypothetical protein
MGRAYQEITRHIEKVHLAPVELQILVRALMNISIDLTTKANSESGHVLAIQFHDESLSPTPVCQRRTSAD